MLFLNIKGGFGVLASLDSGVWSLGAFISDVVRFISVYLRCHRNESIPHRLHHRRARSPLDDDRKSASAIWAEVTLFFIKHNLEVAIFSLFVAAAPSPILSLLFVLVRQSKGRLTRFSAES